MEMFENWSFYWLNLKAPCNLHVCTHYKTVSCTCSLVGVDYSFATVTMFRQINTCTSRKSHEIHIHTFTYTMYINMHIVYVHLHECQFLENVVLIRQPDSVVLQVLSSSDVYRLVEKYTWYR